MAEHHGIPHYHNGAGRPLLTVGAGEFMCIGALPPFDHPHVYLDMGTEDEIVCPYCSTLYRRSKKAEAEAEADYLWVPANY